MGFLNSRVSTVCRNRKHFRRSSDRTSDRQLYSIVTSFSKYRTSSLGSKITETVKVHYAVVSLRVGYPMSLPGPVASSKFTIPISFRRKSFIGNALCMKILLKYISCESNCTLVVTSEGNFIISLAFFFLHCYTLSVFVGVEKQSTFVLGVQLCFRRFPIHDFSCKWWSK